MQREIRPSARLENREVGGGTTFAFTKPASASRIFGAVWDHNALQPSLVSCSKAPSFIKHELESSTCQLLHIFNTRKRLEVRENTVLCEATALSLFGAAVRAGNIEKCAFTLFSPALRCSLRVDRLPFAQCVRVSEPWR